MKKDCTETRRIKCNMNGTLQNGANPRKTRNKRQIFARRSCETERDCKPVFWYLAPSPSLSLSFSVPTHSTWRSVRNSQRKTKFCCKTSVEPSPRNLQLYFMPTLSSCQPFPYVSTSFYCIFYWCKSLHVLFV